MYCTEGTATTSVLLWETLHKDKPENFAFEFKCETFTFTTSQDALHTIKRLAKVPITIQLPMPEYKEQDWWDEIDQID